MASDDDDDLFDEPKKPANPEEDEANSLTRFLDELGDAPPKVESASAPPAEPVSARDEEDDAPVVEGATEPVDVVVGVELVELRPDARKWDAVDRRGEAYYAQSHLKKISPVLREVVRGRVGIVARCAEVVAGDTSGFQEKTIIGSPLFAGLVQPGDGAGEVLLAGTAVASHLLAGRVAGLLGAEITRTAVSMNTRKTKELAQTFAALTRSSAVALMALEKVRLFRHDWKREMRTSFREDETKDFRDGDAATSH